MTDLEIARLRLRRQHLSGPPLATPEAVVGWMGAVQAQEFTVAKWSLAQRSRGTVTSAALDAALAAGRILRTHVLRPTWHFVLAADLRWMVRLTAPRIHARMGSYYRQIGLTDALVARSQVVLRKVLAGGQQLTRKEIAAAFTRARVDCTGLRLGFLMFRAELDLLVCSGALRGKQQTYALVEDRIPPGLTLAGDEALLELTRRYFTSHGPATLKDFLWWSSVPAADARRALQLLEGQALQRLEAGGRTYWLPSGARRPPAPSAAVHLLQAYDELIVAYTESKPVIAAAGPPGMPPGTPLYMNALFRDGQVVGHWRAVPDRQQAVIEAHAPRPLDPAAAASLEKELTRYGRFLQLPARLDWRARGPRARRARRPAQKRQA